MSSAAPRLAVVGASGVVGIQIVELIEQRSFPFSALSLFSSPEGAERTAAVAGRAYRIDGFNDPSDLRECDIVFIAAPESITREIVSAQPAPVLIEIGCARPAAGALLAVPGITPRQRVIESRAQGGFVTPHPAAYVIATVLRALEVDAGFCAATLVFGASIGGRERVQEMTTQTVDLLNTRLDIGPDDPHLAFNLSHAEQGAIDAIAAQASALLGRGPELAIDVLSAPVLHGCGASIQIGGSARADGWRDKLRSAAGILLVEDHQPALLDAINEEAILVSIPDGASPRSLWCAFDNSRIAALCALWIAEVFCEGERPMS